MDYQYHLAKCTGSFRKLTCPSCGRKQCFVPYVDDNNQILHETVGRCDHESSCAYHLTPGQYFQQNPEARPRGDAWRQLPAWAYKAQKKAIQTAPKPQLKGKVCELPKDLVQKTIRPDRPSNFVRFLHTLFDESTVQRLVQQYQLGTTRSGEVIYYEIDSKGRYRGGKLVQYDHVTGKRIKDNTDIPVNWLHPRLIRQGILPKDWTMTQCLFGEHLLQSNPDALVILVEAEKTAVIGAGYLPQYIWVATGGKTQLGDKLDVLKGRKIMAIPDVDAYEVWREAFLQRSYLGIVVSDVIEREATDEEREEQIDIADWLVRAYGGRVTVPPVPPVPPLEQVEHLEHFSNPVANEVARFFSPEAMPAVAAFIEEFDLELVAVNEYYVNVKSKAN